MSRVLVVPGLGGSGAEHWQSRWEADLGAAAVRIAPASFDEPDLDDWMDAIDRAIEPGAVVVAHSLGTLAIARWLASRPGAGVVGALLVAPPDAGGAGFPAVGLPFAVEPVPLPVPSIVVASDDDPYAALPAAEALATGWGSRLVVVPGRGHLNAASGLGDWPEGRALLAELAAASA